MKLSDTIAAFLQNKENSYLLENSMQNYKRKISVFYNYLRDECGASEDYYLDLLIGFRNESIVNSIKYYVKKHRINFQITAENYFTVVKSYFEFLDKQYNIKNENFDSNKKFDILRQQVSNIIKDLNLNKSKEKSPITTDAFLALNEFCNQKIDKNDGNFAFKGVYSKEYTYFVSSIATKILMLTGCKNNILGKILIEDINTEYNKLRINSYWIHLPDNMSKQLKKYLEVRKKILEINTTCCDRLLINWKGEALDNNYSTMFESLIEVINDKKAERVSKFTIQEMIKEQLDPYVILKLTGISFDTYFYCYESLLESSEDDKEVKINSDSNRYLDSKLRGMKNFDLL